MDKFEMLYSKVEKIEDSVEKLTDKMEKYNTVLERNTIIVQEHHKRSNMLEAAFALMREEIQPLKKHVEFINSVAKVVAGSAAVLLFFKKMGWYDSLINFVIN
jgi:lipid II:glycine glycyltransferase (peptidoglycan interpeptide bridge formation enzyme)